MGMLYQLEEELEKTVHQQLQQALQDALNHYRPSCSNCGIVMHRHHWYSRSILSRHGELELSIPVFRCPECGCMESGAELVGEEEGRKRFSKKSAKRR